MTVIRDFGLARPAWSNVLFGSYSELWPGLPFSKHYHTVNEYYLVASGRARVVVDEASHVVGRGDIVCIPAGAEHDILELLEAPLCLFWFMEGDADEPTAAHLHKTAALAQGHRLTLATH